MSKNMLYFAFSKIVYKSNLSFYDRFLQELLVIFMALFTVNKCLKVNYLSFYRMEYNKNTNSHNDMKMTQV